MAGFVLSHTGPFPGLIVLVLLVLLLVTIGRTFRTTGRTLDQLVDATRRIEAGDYSVRVGPAREGNRSTRQLVAGFDTMAARLEADERQRRNLLAEVSHELRTPLTIVQGNLEAIVDGVYPADPAHLEVVLDETRVLGRLIDDLRTLALSEAGTLALHPEPTDPDVLVADVVRSFEPVAAAAGVELAAAIDGDLPILDLDPVRIREVLANLVANAHPAHAAGRPRDAGRIGRSGRPLGPARGRSTPVRASTRRCCPTSSIASSRARRRADRGWGWPSPASSCWRTAARSRPSRRRSSGTTMRVRLPLAGG